jgi:hypothetical protein
MKLKSTRIKTNDFAPDQKELAESLGGTLNPFIDDLLVLLNKNITVEDNLPFEYRTLDVIVDGSGVPTINGSLKTTLRNFKGFVCINAINLDGTGTSPTATPFLVTETSNGTVNIRNITSLPAGVKFRLTLFGLS